MNAIILEFSAPRHHYITGKWPSYDGELDSLLIRRMQTDLEFRATTEAQAILFIGRVFQERELSIVHATIARFETGFTVRIRAVDPDELSPSVATKPYIESDLTEVFEKWPVGETASVYCQASGSLYETSGKALPWHTVDWKSRDEEFARKMGWL